MRFTRSLKLKNGYFMVFPTYTCKPKAVPPNPNFTVTTHPTHILSSSSHHFPGVFSNLEDPLPMLSVCATSSARASLLNCDSESCFAINVNSCKRGHLELWFLRKFHVLSAQLERNRTYFERNLNVIVKILVPSTGFYVQIRFITDENSVPQKTQKIRSVDH